MKAIIFSILAIIFVTVSCTTEEKSPIEGTWELVSASSFFPPDSVSHNILDKSIDLMIFGEKYYCMVWQEESTSESDTVEEGFIFGTYSFQNGVYMDSNIYSSDPSAVGWKTTAHVEFKGDTMLMSILDIPDVELRAVHVRYK